MRCTRQSTFPESLAEHLRLAALLCLASGCQGDVLPPQGSAGMPEAVAGQLAPASPLRAGSSATPTAGNTGSVMSPIEKPSAAGAPSQQAGQKSPAPAAGSGGTATAGNAAPPAAGGAAEPPGGGEPGAAPDAHSIAMSLAASFCDALGMCVGKSALLTITGREDCLVHFATALEQSDLGTLKQSSADGHVAIDAAELEACYRDTRALGCKLQTERLPASCKRAIAGKRAIGEECSVDFECGEGAFCPLGCPRTCQATKASNATCTRDDECQRGLVCSAGKCAAPIAAGASCGASMGATCGLGMSCAGMTAAAAVCQANSAVQVSELGAACDPSGSKLCRDGFSCAYTPTGFTCQAPVAAGAACKLALPGQCPADSYCNARDVMSNGTCVPLPKAGQACVLTDQCAPGHLCLPEGMKPMCFAWLNLGESCTRNEPCRSGSCEQGKCVVRTQCK